MASWPSRVASPLVVALLVSLLRLPVTDAVRMGRTNAWRWQPARFSLDTGRPKREILTPACNGTAAGRPSAIQCPEACPYLRAETTQLCAFACVAPPHCPDENPLSSFANRKTMRCEGCQATACTTCKTAWTCAVCQHGFVLTSRGLCKSPNNIYWYILYAFLGILGVIIGIYAVRLPFREQVNDEVLNKALIFRENSKVLDKSSHQPFDLNTNLGNHLSAGAGLFLHFNWQQAVFWWACMMFGVLVALQFFFNTRPSAIKHDPGTSEAFKACELEIHSQQDDFHVMEQVYFWSVLFIYVLSTVGCLVHAVRQRRRSKEMTDLDITMGDYALLASGFPSQPGSEDVESEMKQFFEQAFPTLTVIGVSVCWDLKDSQTKHWVQERCNDMLQQLDCEHDDIYGQGVRSRIEKFASDASSPLTASQYLATRTCDAELKCLDKAFGIGLAERVPSDSQVAEKVGQVQTSGFAYVVFGTEHQCQTALAASKKNPLVFQHEHKISLEHTGAEPETVIWDNFGYSNFHFYSRFALSIPCLIVLVICLDIFFYAPYVVYLRNYANVKGIEGGEFLQGFLLGLLITVCNQVIYQVIAFVSGMLGFLRVGTQMQFYVVGYTISIFVNTCVDLWTVMLLVQGVSQEDLVTTMSESTATMGESGVLSIKSIAEHPAVQRSVYTQLLTYLFPGCLLVPFMMEPLATNILFYWLPVWLVQSRPEVGVFEAETRLVAPEFDLSRYGDITVNIALCLLALFFTYRDLYMVFLWLIISLILVYAWDHYRFLRCCRQCYFASPGLDHTKDYLMAACCGIIAAALVFRTWAAQDEGFLDHMRDLWNAVLKTQGGPNKVWQLWLLLKRETILWHVGGAFILHCAWHFSLLYWMVPSLEGDGAEHDDTVDYEDTARRTPSTWFNSNPMFALRSKYLFKHEPFAIPVMPGKEYLVKPNKDLGMHYTSDREDFMKSAEERARGSVLEGMRNTVKMPVGLPRFTSPFPRFSTAGPSDVPKGPESEGNDK